MARNILQWLFGASDDTGKDNLSHSDDADYETARERRVRERRNRFFETMDSKYDAIDKENSKDIVKGINKAYDGRYEPNRADYGKNLLKTEQDFYAAEYEAVNRGRWADMTSDGRMPEWSEEDQAYKVTGDDKRYDAKGNPL